MFSYFNVWSNCYLKRIFKTGQYFIVPVLLFAMLSSPPLSLDQENITRRLLALQDSTGYEIVQKHGQRIYGGPPPEWSGPSPDKGTEIYCYRIPRDCFEDELVPVFSTVGRIYELRLMIEFSGTNLSYCYVRYTKQEDAREAIKKLNNYMIRPGYPLAVTRSVDNRKLCIKTIPPLDNETREEEVLQELGNAVEGVDKVKYQTRGWLEVEFTTHRLAALARRQLVPGNVIMFNRVEVKQVDWADPEEDNVGQDIQGKVLSVKNVPSITTHHKVGDLFNSLSGGQVHNVVRARNMVLVTFTTQEGARLAMESSRDVEIDGCKLEVIMWSQRRLDQGNYSSQPRSHPSFHPAGPVEHLHHVCVWQGWGAPEYSLTGRRQDQGTGEQLYQCEVMVPGVPHSQVRGDWSVDREVARISAATRAMQGIIQGSRQLYVAQGQGVNQHSLSQPVRQMVNSSPPDLEPAQALGNLSGNRSYQVPPPSSQFPHQSSQFPQQPCQYLPPTSQPPPPPVLSLPIPQYRPGNTFSLSPPPTIPPSILLSRPDSPKPVLAVPPVYRSSLATPGGAGDRRRV